MLFEAVCLNGTIIEVEGERVYAHGDYYFVEGDFGGSLKITSFPKKDISVIRPKKENV